VSSSEIRLGELIKELQDIYKKLWDLVITQYSYSPSTLISNFDSWIRSGTRWCSMSEEEKNSYRKSYEETSLLFDFYRDYVLNPTITAFDSLIDVTSNVDKMKAENIIKLLTQPLNQITKQIINGWFVKNAREVGKLRGDIFDNYNIFKERWNSMLNEIESRMGRFGLTVKIDERAKELGVPVG